MMFLTSSKSLRYQSLQNRRKFFEIPFRTSLISPGGDCNRKLEAVAIRSVASIATVRLECRNRQSFVDDRRFPCLKARLSQELSLCLRRRSIRLKAAEILAQLRKWNLYAEQGGAVTPSQGGFLVEVVDLSAQPVLDALTASQRRLGPGRRAIDIYLILEV